MATTETAPAPAPSAPTGAAAYSTENCTLGRAMAILGERWTVVVLRELFLGVRRFDDIRRHAGIPRQVLADRLTTLAEHGLVRKEPYREAGSRTRFEYRLTPRGLDLQPVLLAVAAWGDRHLADADGPPLEFVHRDCGAPVAVEIRCAAGHPIEAAREVTHRPGPGARPFETPAGPRPARRPVA